MKAKFKFWTGTEMLTEGFFINADGTVWAWVDYRCTNSFVLKGDLIQYTGLRDKNGVEIYEGDIWDKKDSKGIIIFEESCFQMRWQDGHIDLLSIFIDEISIIGNIYETPELLNLKK